jgi:hypothetical protein
LDCGLAAYAVFTTLNIPAGSIYKVFGRAWILLAVIVPYLIALFVGCCFFTHEGILAVAISSTAVQGAAALISSRARPPASPYVQDCSGCWRRTFRTGCSAD